MVSDSPIIFAWSVSNASAVTFPLFARYTASASKLQLCPTDPIMIGLSAMCFCTNVRSRSTGQIAFGGTQKVYGTVVVISDKDNLLKKAGAIKGKILVSVQTTPHFIPYIKNAKAIITDDGGITCHAAIIARELRIPCIVGTKIATTKLKDGDAVSLDMEHGIITVKKPRRYRYVKSIVSR